jgi:16S rRNA C967 or C1407 C5-methylase (RsmB/RsmF family)/NOL1/NOP2/fmu family ribosome biogenesis protein
MEDKDLYPASFLTRMQALLQGEYPDFLDSLETLAPTSVRLNPNKPASIFADADRVPWCNWGRYLNERPSFTFDPLFHAGAYYVQEASSMFLEQLWKAINPDNAPVTVLDLCAAPGGKSTHLLSLINSDSLLVSNEIIQGRNKVLQQNILKWGHANCIITQNKPENYASLSNYFDMVLIDAPCSGEGLFRKDKDAICEWSEKNVAMCAMRQKEILQHAAQCLKPGGFLIYSTCTFEPDENDNNMEALLQTGFSMVEIGAENIFDGIKSTRFGWQFFPHRVKGEGFYIAALQKDFASTGNLFGRKGSNTSKSKKPDLLNAYLDKPYAFTELTRNNIIFAMPDFMLSDFELIERQLYIRHAGIELGQYKGNDFLPSPGLALSNHLRVDLPSLNLNYNEAVNYLRCESPNLKIQQRGWFLAKYEALNLGWLKCLGNRANNYYPKEWRILKRDNT